MANSTTSKFKYFDTVTDASATGMMDLAGVYWTTYSGAGQDIADNDRFTITDTAGNVIFRKRAGAADDGLEMSLAYPGIKTDGIIVSQLDGGVCIVHIY